jgi:hypothetical protein
MTVTDVPIVYGWTQDDGASNAGPGHLIQAEEDMIGPIKTFASGLSSEEFTELFSHYDPADFQYELDNYNARKEESDPALSVHFFRLSRILRDMLFTCSSINFGHAMAKHSAEINPDFQGVRLYDLNQSMLTPMWKGTGMPYISVSHGSDHNYIFGGHFLEGEVSPADQELSEAFTKSFLNFAYTGNPVSGQAGEFGDWPAVGTEFEAETREVPIQVIGGPFGSGSCKVRADVSEDELPKVHMEGAQEVLGEEVQYVGMKTKAEAQRLEQLSREKLIQRCAFIDSLSATLGV